jgi:hypothetical protein
MRFNLCVVSLAAALALSNVSVAAILYSQNFDVDDTANWTFNSSSAADLPTDNANNEANYFFDYSTVGIPPAPGGVTTRGLKIEANVNDGTGAFMGASASPTGLALPSEYILRAHVWQNANGATTPPGFPGGGAGSTQVTNMTVGATGTSQEFPGGTMSGVQGGATGEGGSGTDWRVYSASMPDGLGAVISPSLHPGVYAAGDTAGDLNNSDAYYTAPFPGKVPPPAQTVLFAQQNGTTANGTPAFAWHEWEMVKTATEVTWRINGTLIATLPASLFPAGFATNPNIALGHMDINTTTTDGAGRPLLFGLFDNVVVDMIPEPGSLVLCVLGAIGLIGSSRRRKG